MNQYQQKKSKGFFHSLMLNSYQNFRVNVIDSQILINVAWFLYFVHILGYDSSLFDYEKNTDGLRVVKTQTSISGSYRYIFHFTQPIRFLAPQVSQSLDIIALVVIGLIILGYILTLVFMNIISSNLQGNIAPTKSVAKIFFFTTAVLFNAVLYLPLMEIIISFMANGCISLRQECTYGNQGVKVVGYFYFILTLGISILFAQLFENCLQYREIGIQKVQKKPFVIFINQFRFLYPFYFQFLSEDLGKTCVFLNHYVIFGSLLYEFYQCFPFTRRNTAHFYLAYWSFGAVFVFLQPFIIYDKIEEQQLICFTIIISIFILKLNYIKYDQLWEKIMFYSIDASKQRDQNWRYMGHKMAMYEDIQQELKQNSELNIQFIQMILQHIEVCNQISCSCQKIKKQKSIAIPINDGQVYIDHLLVADIHMYLIQQHYSEFTFFNKIENIPLFIRYMDYLAFLGRYTQASGKLTLLQSDFNMGKLKMNSVQDAQVEGILSIYKVLMIEKFNRNIEQEKLEEQIAACSFYIQVENEFLLMKKYILQLLNLKLNITETMIDGFQSVQHLLTNTREYIEVLEQIEPQLLNYHYSANYIKSLNILVFFYNEIKNDFRQAKSLVASRAQLKNKVKQPYEHGMINAFSEQVHTIAVSIGQEKGKVISFSHQAPQFFGYSKYEFSLMKNINEIIPQTIAEYHNEIIDDFIITGETQLVEKSQYVMSKNQQGFLVPLYLFISYNYTYADDFIFNAFVCHPTANDYDYEKESLVIVNKEGYLDGCTQTLLNFSNLENRRFDINQLSSFKVWDLFPGYKKWKKQVDKNQTKVEVSGVMFYFPNGKMEEKYSTVAMASKLLARMSLKIEGGNNGLDWTSYICDIQLQKQYRQLRSGQEIEYYLLKLRNLKSVAQNYQENKEEMQREKIGKENSNVDTDSDNFEYAFGRQIQNQPQNYENKQEQSIVNGLMPPTSRDDKDLKAFNTNPNLDDSFFSQGTIVQDEGGLEDVHLLNAQVLPDYRQKGGQLSKNMAPQLNQNGNLHYNNKTDQNGEELLLGEENNNQIDFNDKASKQSQEEEQTYGQKSILKKKKKNSQQQEVSKKSAKTQIQNNLQFDGDEQKELKKTATQKFLLRLKTQLNQKLKNYLKTNGKLHINKTKKHRNNSGSTQNFVLDFNENQNMMGIEQSSVNSSTDGATSMYHQKLDILKDFMENKKKMQKLIYVYALKFAEFVFILLALILQLVIVTGKLNFLENKLYLFESYSDFLQPLSTFVQIGQMTPNLVNSYPGDFSSDDLDTFYDFYTESYISQYASFKQDLDEFQIHETSQQFLETEIEIKSPYDASQSTYMLMSAQYLITEHLKEVLQEDFITMPLDFISNKFLISNYYTIFNFYEQFREDQIKDLVDFNKNLNIIFIIYILVAFALNLSAFILSGINYNRYSADLINILNLMTGVPWQQAQIEKEYILQTIKQIEEYPEVLIEYIDINWSSNFFQDIVEKRREITAQVTEQQTQNKKKKISHIQINSNKINKTMFIIILTLGFILFLTPSLILLINNSIYFNKVDPIFEYLNDFLKTQVYIPAVSVFRFILVDQDTMKNESYLTQSEISDIYSKFEDYLGQLLDFRNQMDIPWSIDSMFSDNYEKLVEQVSEENICKTEYSIIEDDIELCEEIRFGVLKLGFKIALNELYKEKRTDVNIDFSSGDNEDFEASIESYFMVQVLRELIHNIIESSKEQVDKTQSLNSRVTYGFLIGTAFVYFFIFVKYFKSIEKDYRASKKVILLFPAITVLQEDTIVKKVKYYSDQYHIGN